LGTSPVFNNHHKPSGRASLPLSAAGKFYESYGIEKPKNYKLKI